MNYATIKWTDIANGEGVRISLFVSGCTRRCKDCFNAVAWDFSYGKPFDESVRESIYEGLKADYIAGLSLLGGEPLEPENQRALLPFVKEVKKRFPEKSIWCYTGNVFDPSFTLIKKQISAILDRWQIFFLRYCLRRAGRWRKNIRKTVR